MPTITDSPRRRNQPHMWRFVKSPWFFRIAEIVLTLWALLFTLWLETRPSVDLAEMALDLFCGPDDCVLLTAKLTALGFARSHLRRLGLEPPAWMRPTGHPADYGAAWRTLQEADGTADATPSRTERRRLRSAAEILAHHPEEAYRLVALGVLRECRPPYLAACLASCLAWETSPRVRQLIEAVLDEFS